MFLMHQCKYNAHLNIMHDVLVCVSMTFVVISLAFMLQHESPLDQGRLDLCSVNEAYEIPTTKIGAR